MDDEALIADMAAAILRIGNALRQHGLEPPTAIYVPRETGMRFKSARFAGIHPLRDRHNSPDYCATICGVDICMERR